MTRSDNPTNQPVLWEELTWEQITQVRDSGINMVILPIGATEQHGLHLPVGVDTFSAIAVAHGVSAQTGIPVLPALAYGCSLGHSKKWPGTISLRPETLAKLILEIAEWVYSAGFQRLLLLNGHVTNWAPLRCGLEKVRHTYPDFRIALRSLWEITPQIHQFYHQDAANFHANCAETSMMLALRPDLVQMDKALDEPDRSAGCFFAYTVNKESVHGAVGTPSQADFNFGKQILESCVAELSAQLQRAMSEGTPLEEMPPTIQ
ncbi:creatininase family protein [Trichocoleus sp. FACHB-262]|uniref:creatininase family protein n=1 Tax=Trichocoleus sp. FACHB-262 TaxID=2692869 RepID=UPI001688DCA6|nr:creatininase family protein [Trichocoleus sp. FACHB-262]MBD2120740.1 creatininase family protein [Trichocoleus sp. FACHB-262]